MTYFFVCDPNQMLGTSASHGLGAVATLAHRVWPTSLFALACAIMQPNCSPFEQLQFRSDVIKRKLCRLSFCNGQLTRRHCVHDVTLSQQPAANTHAKLVLCLVDAATCAPAVVVIVDAVVVAAVVIVVIVVVAAAAVAIVVVAVLLLS
jgi:hypothetical protein